MGWTTRYRSPTAVKLRSPPHPDWLKSPPNYPKNEYSGPFIGDKTSEAWRSLTGVHCQNHERSMPHDDNFSCNNQTESIKWTHRILSSKVAAFLHNVIPSYFIRRHIFSNRDTTAERTKQSNKWIKYCNKTWHVYALKLQLFYKYLNQLHIHLYKTENYPCNRPCRPIGLGDVEAPTFSRQSAHRWRWGCQPYAPAALYPQKIPGTHFC
jgi:hypothetical protein